MPDLIPPHGGVAEPVNRTVASLGGPFTKNIVISDADLSSLYRIGDGGLSPLTGPMDRTTFQQVLTDQVIRQNGKDYAWTIPIAFPVDKSLGGSLKIGQVVALINAKQELVGTLEITDIFPFDRSQYIKSVYGTVRTDHPGGKMVMGAPRSSLLGGFVRVRSEEHT